MQMLRLLGLLLYWPALARAAEGTEAAPSGTGIAEAAPGLANNVSLSVFYGATCIHCLAFLQVAVLPLLHAKLPGDRVQLSVIPWVPDPLSKDNCITSLPCNYARSALCELNSTTAEPANINSSDVNKSVEFTFCALQNAVKGATPPEHAEALPRCAKRAGLSWSADQGLQSCTEGGGGWELLQSASYRDRIEAAREKLIQHPHQVAPFIFLNGQILDCPDPLWCKALKSSTGDEELKKPGTLLRVVCSMLNPAPHVCLEVLAQADGKRPSPSEEDNIVKQAQACESCVELGGFQWHGHWTLGRPGASIAVVALASAAVAFAIVGGSVWVFRATAPMRCSFPRVGVPLHHELERGFGDGHSSDGQGQ